MTKKAPLGNVALVWRGTITTRRGRTYNGWCGPQSESREVIRTRSYPTLTPNTILVFASKLSIKDNAVSLLLSNSLLSYALVSSYALLLHQFCCHLHLIYIIDISPLPFPPLQTPLIPHQCWFPSMPQISEPSTTSCFSCKLYHGLDYALCSTADSKLDSILLPKLVDGAYNIIYKSLAPITQLVYGTGLLQFTQFCDSWRIDRLDQMPASVALLTAFVLQYMGAYSGKTINSWLAGLWAHMVMMIGFIWLNKVLHSNILCMLQSPPNIYRFCIEIWISASPSMPPYGQQPYHFL